MNNPVRYSDPTGHYTANSEDADCFVLETYNSCMGYGWESNNNESEPDASSSNLDGKPEDCKFICTENISIPLGAESECVPYYVVRVCLQFSRGLVYSNNSIFTVSPETFSLGSISGNPFTGILTIWAPTINLPVNDNTILYNKIGIEASYSQVTNARFQHITSVKEGPIIVNTQLNITAGYNPKQFRNLKLVVEGLLARKFVPQIRFPSVSGVACTLLRLCR